MPINYEIDQNSGTLFVKWSGEILPRDMAVHMAALVEDPNFERLSLALTDIREADLVFTWAQLWKTIDDHYRETLESKAIKVAVLVANDQQEQAARRFMAIVPKTVVGRVFYDHEQASEWLKRNQESETES